MAAFICFSLAAGERNQGYARRAGRRLRDRAKEAPLRGRDRHDNDVVLAAAKGRPRISFSSMTPITLKGTRSILIDCPTGSAAPKRVLAVMVPRTATRATVSRSRASNKRPRAARKLRTVSKLGVVPVTVVLVLLPPAVTCKLRLKMGATSAMSGQHRGILQRLGVRQCQRRCRAERGTNARLDA